MLSSLSFQLDCSAIKEPWLSPKPGAFLTNTRGPEVSGPMVERTKGLSGVNTASREPSGDHAGRPP